MKENITTELSNALKNGDKERIHTLRLVLAAIKAVSYTHLTLPTNSRV